MFSPQRSMGQYGTPQETVDYMVKSLLGYLDDGKQSYKILDPSTGDGIFLRSLIRSGVPPSSLVGLDIDPEIPSPHEEITFSHADFLREPNEEKYDAIIGNPPYKSKRQSTYLQENKDYLSKEFQSIGIHNMYSLFIYKGLQQLKRGGVLSMIVQDSFLSNVYYKRFRKYLLQHTEIKEIILAPRRLFHKGKADVRTAILTLIKKYPSDINPEHKMKLIDRLIDQNYFEPMDEQVQHLP
ncbi:class I SAM-dependent DNA methyltransferase, partial [Halobacillus sp. BBL2006]|uniref:HsdM family class I SAM-dependent methyltransferase n=1 Tax=Halobacillus sp. BBL2006 TaxID=1543706 RepID=UPI000541C6D6